MSEPEYNSPIIRPNRDYGLSAQELDAAFDELGDGSALSESFTDGEHWDTRGLTDRQIELLTGKLQKVEKAKRQERRLGRFGLK